ncbi:FAD-binding oxidoreductase [Nonomuraea africana]|uniref:FAD/FMN-containing dehydrogenase n=1 Tax=Nonomuraea africana TaxID=46171 RepID=A0ABR9KQI1_9ACTN|nr:FAD-binding oxidoreductase [Nonomuraea africana]MBE1564287.1 FAD/FMN-containing dehydrogenase [Nonomuraea africana]
MTNIKGTMLLPGDEGFEQAAKPWNLSVTQPVAAVVTAQDADDVAAVVRHARQAGLSVTAQPSGHGASGDTEGVILLRTGRLDEVEINAEEWWARVGAGAKWGEVQAAAGAHGLTGLAGSSPVVSVAGYTLGGGLSWFGRRYGWAADSVRAFEVVDADGTRATVSADSDADLFWALRGGGGDHALVTAIEFDLHPAPDLYGGRMIWPADRAAEVLGAFREITAEAPPELSVWLNRLRFPSAPPMVAVDVTYLGQTAEAQSLLSRLDKIDGVMSDTRAGMAVADLGDIAAEPKDPGPALSRAELLTGLDDAAVEILLAEPAEPLINVQLRHLGGALAEQGPGAVAAVTEPYLLYMLGLSLNPQLAQAVTATQDRLARALGGYVSGRKPYTFLAPGERAADAFPEETHARLREVKRARDPQQVIRANFPV